MYFLSHVSLPVSNYIQEILVTPAIGEITVLCNLAQSDPALICHTVFYYADSVSSATVNVSSGTTKDFPANQLCNITVQVVLSNNSSQILDQMVFANVNVISSVELAPVEPSISKFFTCYTECYLTVILGCFILKMQYFVGA